MEGKLGEIVFLKAKAMKMTNFLKNKFNAANISLKVLLSQDRIIKEVQNRTSIILK